MTAPNLWRDVAEFNIACGVTLYKTPTWIPADELDLAVGLVGEEFTELRRALTDRDLVEAADGVVDSLYVLAGLALRLGIARRSVSGIIVDSPEPLGFEQLNPGDVLLFLRELNDLEAEIIAAGEARALAGAEALQPMSFGVHRAIFAVVSISQWLGLPMIDLWQEVHRSNMAKVVRGKVIRNGAGKILKPRGWQSPDIAGVLTAHGWVRAA